MSLEKESSKEKSNTTTFLMLIIALACFYGGDAVGYHDGDPIKLFTGEAWPLLLGSGHSVSAVAIAYAFFKTCDLLILDKPFDAKAEAILVGGLLMLFEIAGSTLNSVADPKDVATILAFVTIYYITDVKVGQVISYLAEHLKIPVKDVASASE